MLILFIFVKIRIYCIQFSTVGKLCLHFIEKGMVTPVRWRKNNWRMGGGAEIVFYEVYTLETALQVFYHGYLPENSNYEKNVISNLPPSPCGC